MIVGEGAGVCGQLHLVVCICVCLCICTGMSMSMDGRRPRLVRRGGATSEKHPAVQRCGKAKKGKGCSCGCNDVIDGMVNVMTMMMMRGTENNKTWRRMGGCTPKGWSLSFCGRASFEYEEEKRQDGTLLAR
jgi:hypothetical protein